MQVQSPLSSTSPQHPLSCRHAGLIIKWAQHCIAATGRSQQRWRPLSGNVLRSQSFGTETFARRRRHRRLVRDKITFHGCWLSPRQHLVAPATNIGSGSVRCTCPRAHSNFFRECIPLATCSNVLQQPRTHVPFTAPQWRKTAPQVPIGGSQNRRPFAARTNVRTSWTSSRRRLPSCRRRCVLCHKRQFSAAVSQGRLFAQRLECFSARGPRKTRVLARHVPAQDMVLLRPSQLFYC